MWFPASITTAATVEPVTLDEARDQCAIDAFDDDVLLARLIEAARDHVESYCNIRLSTQTVAVKCDGFSDLGRLSVAPVQSISSISYVDVDGAEQMLSASVYELWADGLEAAVVLKYGQSWPAIQVGSRITLTAVVGFSAIPAAIKHALLLYLSESFGTRENARVGEWTAVDSLLCNHRRGAI